jgi:ELWxxDGT repeat protein
MLGIGAFTANAQPGVQMVYDIVPGPGASSPSIMTVYNGAMYFTANDGAHGQELWKYTGSGAPTMVYDLNPGAADGATYGSAMAVFNNKLYFPGKDSTGHYGLFVYDGINNPVQAPNQYANLSSSYYLPFGSKLYFVGDGTLYAYDGVNTPVKIPVNTGTAPEYVYEPTLFNGKIVFRGRNGAYGGDGLFQYDTSTATVSVVNGIAPTAIPFNPASLTVLNGKLYFYAWDNAHGYELWSYDGTNTTRLTDIAPGTGSGTLTAQHMMAGYKNDIYFNGSVDAYKYQLYRYNTSTGTASVVHVFNATSSGTAMPTNFIKYNGKLYFSATGYQDTVTYQVWSTDSVTTKRVTSICGQTCTAAPTWYCVFGNSLYFNARTSTYGYELYRFTDTATALQVVSTPTAPSVAVYPNPAHGDATLSIALPAPETLSITLSDLSGRLVWSKRPAQYSGNSKLQLPTAEIAPGLYFYQLRNTNGDRIGAGKLLLQ